MEALISSVRCRRLKYTISKLSGPDDLERKGEKILDTLSNEGHILLTKAPRLLLDMVRKAPNLIRSDYYVQIIQRMAGIYMGIPNELQIEPLDCLIQQMDDARSNYSFICSQSNFLSVVKMLIPADCHMLRTKCLRMLIINAQHTSEIRLQKPFFKWSEQLIEVLKELLNKEADPTWIPEGCDESALYRFINRVFLILAYENNLAEELLELLPLFLTEKCLNHQEPNGPESVLHALLNHHWNRLCKVMPAEFLEHCKSIVSLIKVHLDMLDMTDGNARPALHSLENTTHEHQNIAKATEENLNTTRLHFLADIVCEHPNRVQWIAPLFQLLKTPENMNSTDSDGRTVLHYLAIAVQHNPNEVQGLLPLFQLLKTPENMNSTDSDGETVLYYLATEVQQNPNEVQGLLPLFQLLKTPENMNSKDSDGKTVLHCLAIAVQHNPNEVQGLLPLFQLLKTPENMNSTDSDGETVLHCLAIAVQKNPNEVQGLLPLFQLLKTPENMNSKDSDGKTVLHCLAIAVQQNPNEVQGLLPLFQLLKTPENMNSKDSDGETVLHCLAIAVQQNPNEVQGLLPLFQLLKTPENMNSKDSDGETVLNYLATEVQQNPNEAQGLLPLFHLLTTPVNVNSTDIRGRTPLHAIAQITYEHPNEANLPFFPLLSTQQNVNTRDKDYYTPYSWIVYGLIMLENEPQRKNLFSEINELLTRQGADLNHAIAGKTFEVTNLVLGNSDCNYDRLEWLLRQLKSVTDSGSHEDSMMEINEEAKKNLAKISNTKFLKPVMNILSILLTNTSIAQDLWDSTFPEDAQNCILSNLEILSLCAERGAKPTQTQLKYITSETKAFTRDEEFAEPFLKTLVSMHKNKDFKTADFVCNLNFLADFYLVSQNMITLGKELLHLTYDRMEDVKKSSHLINCYLFISNNEENVEDLRSNISCDNWLHRSPLHLAAIFLESLNYLPQSILQRYINERDSQGCTPLHVAYLHHNELAVKFLLAHGADPNATDNFGLTPELSGRYFRGTPSHAAGMAVPPDKTVKTSLNDSDYEHHILCCDVLKANSSQFKVLRPLLFLSEMEVRFICKFKYLFESLLRNTDFESAKVVMAGSLREKLKSGRADEADIQLWFKGRTEYDPLGQCFRIEEKLWHTEEFMKDLANGLIGGLNMINWQGIYLRPIDVKGPWKFIREDSIFRGTVISVDVVPILVDEDGDNNVHNLQQEILEDAQSHRHMEYVTLDTWKRYKEFKETMFAHEWDIIDSLPTGCRLGIVIAKAIVQAYDWSRSDRRVKISITSYMIKTAVFYLLAYSRSQLHFNPSGKYSTDGVLALKHALLEVEGRIEIKRDKLKFNPNPKWATDEDLDEHGEEARVWAYKIFSLIKYLSNQGWKLDNFWNRQSPVQGLKLYGGFGEAQYICDICDRALQWLGEETSVCD